MGLESTIGGLGLFESDGLGDGLDASAFLSEAEEGEWLDIESASVIVISRVRENEEVEAWNGEGVAAWIV